MCGTVAYMPPEMIMGKNITPSSADCWSLGICIFVCFLYGFPYPDPFLHMLESGHPSSKNSSFFEIVHKSILTNIGDPNLVRVLCEHLLVINPEHRNLQSLLSSNLLDCNCGEIVPVAIVEK